MEPSTLWWLLTGVAIAVELVTGTFYLLMLSIGLAAGAISAYAGGSLPAQLVIAATVGAGAITAWYLQRSRHPAPAPATANKDVNLDIGETVQVDAWRADGTAAVRYRGAQWTAVPVAPQDMTAGPHRVREVVGNRLVLEKI